MGYLEIPVINVTLPIYHGTSQEVLRKGVGHMNQSALPVGGQNNHCILTGHSGLPSAKLFTELTTMSKGDLFYLKVLEDTLVYKVDQILTIEPDDTKDLHPVRGEDYVTLITCTPYGVNSHRLLVRGKRIENTRTDIIAEEKNEWMEYVMILLIIWIRIIRK